MDNIDFTHPLPSFLSALQQRGIQEARRMLYALVGAKKEDQLIFTSSGAEGTNHAIYAAYIGGAKKMGKNHFLCSSLQEVPALMAMSRLQQLGCVLQVLEANSKGFVTYQSVVEKITPRTAMLSLNWGNGLTGVIQPLQEIALLCKERGILLHIDASYILGKGQGTFEESGADILTFQSPIAGMGGMFIRQGVEIPAFIIGAPEQPLRAGLLPPQGMIELGQWAKKSLQYSDYYCTEVARLRSLFEHTIKTHVPDAALFCAQEERLPNVSCMQFPAVFSEALVCLLQQKGVLASCGSASTHYLFHLLKACGLEQDVCHTGISFAFSEKTTQEDIEQGALHVAQSVLRLRTYSQDFFKDTL